MNFNLSVQTGISFLLIIVSGAAGENELFAANQFVAELIRRSAARRVLLDMLAFTPLVDAHAQRRVAEHLESVMPQVERFAILVQAGRSFGMVSRAAKNLGISVVEFSELTEAERWLAAR